MSINLCAFLRFGSKEHIMDLYENGTVFCNSIQTFLNLDNSFRGDKFEGIATLRNYAASDIKSFEIHPNDKSCPPIILHPTRFQLREFYSKMKANIYCIYVVKTEEVLKSTEPYKIHNDNKQFGSHILLIYDVQRFWDLLTGELNIKGYKFEHGLIEYYDGESYNGELTPFHKRKEYSYQSELRFLISNPTSEPLIIKLGSLKGVSQVIEMKDLSEIEVRRR
jgi:hypothetical protein